MVFTHRNLFNLVVQGTSEKILPVYVHILEEDLMWMNERQCTVLEDLCHIIEENLDFIEKKSRLDNKESLSQISGGDIVSCYFTIRDLGNQGRSNILRVSGEGIARSCSTASFSLCVWLRPIGSSDITALFPDV